jgi:hypothetical protein
VWGSTAEACLRTDRLWSLNPVEHVEVAHLVVAGGPDGYSLIIFIDLFRKDGFRPISRVIFCLEYLPKQYVGFLVYVVVRNSEKGKILSDKNAEIYFLIY